METIIQKHWAERQQKAGESWSCKCQMLPKLILFEISPQQRRWPSSQEVIISEGFPRRRLILREWHTDIYQHIQQPLLAQPKTQLWHQLLHTLQWRHTPDLLCSYPWCTWTWTGPECRTLPQYCGHSTRLSPTVPPRTAHNGNNNNIVCQWQPHAPATQDTCGHHKLCSVSPHHGTQQRLCEPKTSGTVHTRAAHPLLCSEPSHTGTNGCSACHGACPKQSRLAGLKSKQVNYSLWKKKTTLAFGCDVWNLLMKTRQNMGWSSPLPFTAVSFCMSRPFYLKTNWFYSAEFI